MEGELIRTALPPYILALDQATRTGWAMVLAATGQVVRSGVFDCRGGRSAAGESRGMRFLRFATWLDGLVQPSPPVLVCHEQTISPCMAGRGSSWATSDVAAGLKGLIETAAARAGVPVTSVCPATLKKWATGSGRAGKPEMIRAARDRTGIDPRDDNEADAILIGLWTFETYRAGLNA